VRKIDDLVVLRRGRGATTRSGVTLGSREGWSATSAPSCSVDQGWRGEHDAPMRGTFAHDAVLTMGEQEDQDAPGAAITAALCGSWDHEPPCPLAPHHTSSHRQGERVRLRVLFATEPDAAAEVRRRIDAALARGALRTPGRAVTTWRVEASAPGTLRPDEEDHGRRLVSS
jgi:hypothetical protein